MERGRGDSRQEEQDHALQALRCAVDQHDGNVKTQVLTLCRNSLHSSFPSGACALKLAASSASVAGSHSSKSMPLRMPRNLLLT